MITKYIPVILAKQPTRVVDETVGYRGDDINALDAVSLDIPEEI